MEYVQERIATLHEFGEGDGMSDALARDAAAAVGETAIVVPMTAREYESPAAERVLGELERLEPAPAAVFVPVRADDDEIGAFREWLDSFALPTRVLWCNSPGVDALLAEAGLAGDFGKGRDVWLALGPAANEGDTVVVHDADARSYEAEHVRRLLAPLTMDYEFSKGTTLASNATGSTVGSSACFTNRSFERSRTPTTRRSSTTSARSGTRWPASSPRPTSSPDGSAHRARGASRSARSATPTR